MPDDRQPKRSNGERDLDKQSPRRSESANQENLIKDKEDQRVYEDAFQNLHRNDHTLSDSALLSAETGMSLEEYRKRVENNRFTIVNDGGELEAANRITIDYVPVQNGDKTFALGVDLEDLPSERKLSSEMDSEIAIKALSETNPALAPVAILKEYTNSLPPGEEKSRLQSLAREQAADLSPEMREHYSKKSASESDSWLNATHSISKLPLHQQFDAIGAGLTTGLDQYAQEQRQRAFGRLLGTVEGTSQVLQNLAKVTDFTAALLTGDKENAAKAGADFGTAVGQTVVGGVRIFETADRYLFELGYRGDFSKPFQDIAELGRALNYKWSQTSPFEQERLKSKLITELIGDGVVGGTALSGIQRAGTFTKILDTIAVESSELFVASKHAAHKAAKTVGKVVDEFATPAHSGYGGFDMPIPRTSASEETSFLMSKMDKFEPPAINGRKARLEDRTAQQTPPETRSDGLKKALETVDERLADQWSSRLESLSGREDFAEREVLIKALVKEKVQNPSGKVDIDVVLHDIPVGALKEYESGIQFVHNGRVIPDYTPTQIKVLQRDASRRLDKFTHAVKNKPEEIDESLQELKAFNSSLKEIAPESEILIPKGVHIKTFADIERMFTGNEKRKELFKDFMRWAREMKEAGCETVYLDGSFITKKVNPGDFDACWEVFTPVKSPTESLLLSPSREGIEWRKKQFKGDIFARYDSFGDRVAHWQKDERTDELKGIIKLDLRELNN